MGIRGLECMNTPLLQPQGASSMGKAWLGCPSSSVQCRSPCEEPKIFIGSSLKSRARILSGPKENRLRPLHRQRWERGRGETHESIHPSILVLRPSCHVRLASVHCRAIPGGLWAVGMVFTKAMLFLEVAFLPQHLQPRFCSLVWAEK